MEPCLDSIATDLGLMWKAGSIDFTFRKLMPLLKMHVLLLPGTLPCKPACTILLQCKEMSAWGTQRRRSSQRAVFPCTGLSLFALCT